MSPLLCCTLYTATCKTSQDRSPNAQARVPAQRTTRASTRGSVCCCTTSVLPTISHTRPLTPAIDGRAYVTTLISAQRRCKVLGKRRQDLIGGLTAGVLPHAHDKIHFSTRKISNRPGACSGRQIRFFAAIGSHVRPALGTPPGTRSEEMKVESLCLVSILKPISRLAFAWHATSFL